MPDAKHAAEGEADEDQTYVSYQADNYDRLPKPVERPTGEEGTSETVAHASYDAEALLAGPTFGTVTAETKVVKPADKGVSTK